MGWEKCLIKEKTNQLKEIINFNRKWRWKMPTSFFFTSINCLSFLFIFACRLFSKTFCHFLKNRNLTSFLFSEQFSSLLLLIIEKYLNRQKKWFFLASKIEPQLICMGVIWPSLIFLIYDDDGCRSATTTKSVYCCICPYRSRCKCNIPFPRNAPCHGRSRNLDACHHLSFARVTYRGSVLGISCIFCLCLCKRENH